jgi:CheY-like chemotaxis protein
MPVLDGWHFLERLRKPPAATGPPIIVTTGSNLTREWAESHGCAGFVRKPIQETALLAEVRRCLGEA